MAIFPSTFSGKERLQPGARGETFQADLPGYRGGEDRINRTQNKLNTSAHDVPNIKYQFDFRLPVLFRYGFAYGFNQIVVPKGRIVAVDPFMDLVDFDMQKQHNTMTLANGGAPAMIRNGETYKVEAAPAVTDLVEPVAQGTLVHGQGREWAPVIGFDKAYTTKTYRPFKEAGPVAQLPAGLAIDTATGRVVDQASGSFIDSVRPGNHPIGMLQRNEYTRDDDAFNGMMAGPVLTDAMVELPWFTYKNKAEQNPWGSAYGGLFPGALVKSDENGRFIVSPLSYEDEVATMSISEYELERQQVVGQVYSVNNNLLPEGAARWATWSLEDRLKFEDFNPSVWKENGRRGEDAVANSPYASTGAYPGYPYDKAYKNHDLHMLSSGGRLDNYDLRMNFEHQYENLGIPGLTDGKNVATRTIAPVTVGHMNKADGEYIELYFRTTDVDVYDMEIQIGENPLVAVVEGATVDADGAFKVTYANDKQGIIRIAITDKALADAALAAGPVPVKLGFKKRGLAGVPTFMDWDGCVGSVKVLLTK